MINLELNLVRSFVAIAEVRSFTRAGERLGRSQSAISLQIRRLEDQIRLLYTTEAADDSKCVKSSVGAVA